MKKNLKDITQEVESLFKSSPNANQKAWGLINDFYHLVLTYMENKKIKQADLARKLGKSRSAISQMFNQTPNISIKKMVEIADAIGISLFIESPEVNSFIEKNAILEMSFSKVDNLWVNLISDQAMRLIRTGEIQDKDKINDLRLDYKSTPKYSDMYIN